MLKPKINPYDIIAALPAEFGTDPTPQWCLIWNATLAQWSAFAYDQPDQLLEVALDPDWLAICLVEPEALMRAINSPRPDLIGQALHKYATLGRMPASELSLDDFHPAKPESPALDIQPEPTS